MNKSITVREGTIKEVVRLSKLIEEFTNPHSESVYENRMNGKDQLILVATVDDELVGFKVGYDKFGNGSFYTWMGGVKKAYRRLGIAKKLAERQEEYAKQNGYQSVVLKTRNRHRNMLLFALNLGYKIIEVLPMESVEENRIILKKQLK